MDIDCLDIGVFSQKGGFMRLYGTFVFIYGFRVIKLSNGSLQNVYSFMFHILLNVLLNAAM